MITRFRLQKLKNPDSYQSFRQLGKKLNFGLVFGMSYLTLQKSLEEAGIFQPLELTKKYYYKWHSTYKNIKIYGERMQNLFWKSKFWGAPSVFSCYQVKKRNKHFITSFAGRAKREKIHDSGEILNYQKFCSLSKNLLTECVNFPVQSTGADILLDIWLETLKWEKGLARVSLTIHDEFLIETSKHNFHFVKKQFEEIVEKVGLRYLKNIGLQTQTVGPLYSWGTFGLMT